MVEDGVFLCNPDRGFFVLVLTLVEIEFQGHRKLFLQRWKIVGVFASAIERYTMPILKSFFR